MTATGPMQIQVLAETISLSWWQTETQLEALRNTAKKLGATTSYSASEVASLMTELGRAGFKPDQIIDMTAAVMNLARATGTDATLASGIIAASVMNTATFEGLYSVFTRMEQQQTYSAMLATPLAMLMMIGNS